jgi:hypothetical protein
MHIIIADVAMLAIDDDALLIRILACGDEFILIVKALTSSPVAATTWAVRRDGSPMKVRTGFALDLNAFKTRRFGFGSVIV